MTAQRPEVDTTVCMKHMRFAPCRPCTAADDDWSFHWSALPSDIEKVRQWQNERSTDQ